MPRLYDLVVEEGKLTMYVGSKIEAAFLNYLEAWSTAFAEEFDAEIMKEVRDGEEGNKQRFCSCRIYGFLWE